MLDPLAIAGDQEVFLVWLSFVDPEAEVQSPFAGQDMRIFRTPLPVDDSLVDAHADAWRNRAGNGHEGGKGCL